jgi:hypothetical protein
MSKDYYSYLQENGIEPLEGILELYKDTFVIAENPKTNKNTHTWKRYKVKEVLNGD